MGSQLPGLPRAASAWGAGKMNPQMQAAIIMETGNAEAEPATLPPTGSSSGLAKMAEMPLLGPGNPNFPWNLLTSLSWHMEG